jgi:hypothetical protein
MRIPGVLLAFAIACTIPVIRAQTFRGVDYLYRAADANQEKPKLLPGILACNSATQTVSFESTLKDEKRSLFGKIRIAPHAAISVAAASVVSAAYERASRPRYAAGILLAWPLLFTKEKKHYLTLQYTADAGERKYAIFRLDKKVYQEVLAAEEH